MADRMFTLKDWEKMKRDIFDDFFEGQRQKYDMKEQMKISLTGEDNIAEEIPADYHIMPSGEIMKNSEMLGYEGG